MGMNKIKILDDSISNIIAAGEVVENPATMIKELLENSLDAGSKKISIEVLKGGTYVKISDDGSGMSFEDVLLSIERHATSKISKKEDIFNLSTYGFRGEALASISSVSKLSISSKIEEDKLGTILNSYGGVIRKYERISRNKGTEIEIRDLFYNTPARKKFLRKDITEYNKIKDIVLKEALANPDVAITLNIEGRLSIKTSGSGMQSTIFEIFGKNVLKNLMKFKYGYLGNVEILKSSKEYIFTYVNGRYVKSNVLERAVIDAYYTKLMKGKYPFVILNFNINPNEIDVNVHPSKKIIKFSDEKIVYNQVKNEIDNFFYEYDRINWQPDLKPKIVESVKEEINEFNFPKKEEISKRSEYTEKLYQNPFFEDENEEEITLKEEEKVEDYLEEFYASMYKEEKNDYEVLGQIFNTYILVKRDDALEIYDQHIIHERILYEELMEEFSKKEISKSFLLIPEVLEITPMEKDLLFNNIEVFNSFGFEIDEISEKQIAIRSYPNFELRDSKKNILNKILKDLTEKNKVRDIREDVLTSMSCRGAIKAGEILSMDLMKKMVKKLHEVKKYTCPHGRPIISKITKYDLDKLFGRVK